MKYFDIVNENDEITGSATAQECHTNSSLIHRVVHFTLVDVASGKVLISQRFPKVKFDSGKWCFMGEHLLKGDDYPTALWRGVEDELGIRPEQQEGGGEWFHNIFHYDQQTEFTSFL